MTAGSLYIWKRSGGTNRPRQPRPLRDQSAKIYSQTFADGALSDPPLQPAKRPGLKRKKSTGQRNASGGGTLGGGGIGRGRHPGAASVSQPLPNVKSLPAACFMTTH